jgi:cytochrome c-type biogenesis protein CcmE
MSRKLLAGTVVLSAAILAVVFSMNEPSAAYSRSISEFLGHPLYDRTVRIQGTLVPGSLCYQAEPCEYRFRLEEPWYSRTDAGVNRGKPQLSVHYPYCIVPDTFRWAVKGEVAVTVEGRQCASCHHFEASSLFVKVPSKYEMKEMKMRDAGPPPEPLPQIPVPVCPKS